MGILEVNPYLSNNPFDILVIEGLGGIAESLNDVDTASISRLGREKDGEFTPANTEKADSNRLVYAKGCHGFW